MSMERAPFPPWLRELCYFGGIIVTLTLFGASLKGDQRSANEKLDRMQTDVQAFSSRLSTIEGRLPNKEADDLWRRSLEKQVSDNKSALDFEIAKLNKWKEDTDRLLIKKGIE